MPICNGSAAVLSEALRKELVMPPRGRQSLRPRCEGLQGKDQLARDEMAALRAKYRRALLESRLPHQR